MYGHIPRLIKQRNRKVSKGPMEELQRFTTQVGNLTTEQLLVVVLTQHEYVGRRKTFFERAP